jgi:hypothetical protein
VVRAANKRETHGRTHTQAHTQAHNQAHTQAHNQAHNQAHGWHKKGKGFSSQVQRSSFFACTRGRRGPRRCREKKVPMRGPQSPKDAGEKEALENGFGPGAKQWGPAQISIASHAEEPSSLKLPGQSWLRVVSNFSSGH